jgi:hypothetical protein
MLQLGVRADLGVFKLAFSNVTMTIADVAIPAFDMQQGTFVSGRMSMLGMTSNLSFALANDGVMFDVTFDAREFSRVGGCTSLAAAPNLLINQSCYVLAVLVVGLQHAVGRCLQLHQALASCVDTRLPALRFFMTRSSGRSIPVCTRSATCCWALAATSIKPGAMLMPR